MILPGLKIIKNIVLPAVLIVSFAGTFVPKASAQEQASAKVQLEHALTFVGFNTKAIKFDLPTDPAFAADNANYKYHLYITSQSNETVVAFSNNDAAIKDMANAAILLYEVGQVRNVDKGITATNP